MEIEITRGYNQELEHQQSKQKHNPNWYEGDTKENAKTNSIKQWGNSLCEKCKYGKISSNPNTGTYNCICTAQEPQKRHEDIQDLEFDSDNNKVIITCELLTTGFAHYAYYEFIGYDLKDGGTAMFRMHVYPYGRIPRLTKVEVGIFRYEYLKKGDLKNEN